jgi:hypothetical protein
MRCPGEPSAGARPPPLRCHPTTWGRKRKNAPNIAARAVQSAARRQGQKQQDDRLRLNAKPLVATSIGLKVASFTCAPSLQWFGVMPEISLS